MIKEFLNSFEDAKRPLLAPNYWILKKIGLILPENKLAKAAYIFLHELATYFVLSQYMELYVIRSDLDLVLINLKISMLSTVCVVKANTYMFWQSQWREVLDYVTAADKYERDTRDEVKDKILDTYTKYCRTVTYLYWFLVFTTSVTVTHTPLIKYLSSANYREELRNGTELFPHIFSSWMPFDKYHTPGSWITIFWHVFICAYGATIAAAYDTSIVVVLVFFGGKLDLLRERSKQMLGNGGVGVSDEHASKMVHELHEVHALLTKYKVSSKTSKMKIRLLFPFLLIPLNDYGRRSLFFFVFFNLNFHVKYSRMFNSLLSPVMFVYVVMCALMLCASAFQLTSAQTTTQKVLMAEYLIFGISQLFVFCWHSNIVVVKSEDVVYGPYESEWWAANVYQRKAIHILSGQFRIKHMFTAGPFTNLTLSTFIAILKGAYSYYTLLNK